MANPSAVKIKENAVKKVATNVTSGTISRHPTKGRNLYYYATYRLTGGAAPTYAEVVNTGTLLFQNNKEQAVIDSSESIDVYMVAELQDGKTQQGWVVVGAS